jgi:hypothetical protein
MSDAQGAFIAQRIRRILCNVVEECERTIVHCSFCQVAQSLCHTVVPRLQNPRSEPIATSLPSAASGWKSSLHLLPTSNQCLRSNDTFFTNELPKIVPKPSSSQRASFLLMTVLLCPFPCVSAAVPKNGICICGSVEYSFSI